MAGDLLTGLGAQHVEPRATRVLNIIFPEGGESTLDWLNRSAGIQPHDWAPDAIDRMLAGPGKAAVEVTLRESVSLVAVLLLEAAGYSEPLVDALTALAVSAATGCRIADELVTQRLAYMDGRKATFTRIHPEHAFLLSVFLMEAAANIIRRYATELGERERLALYRAVHSETVRACMGRAVWFSWLNRGVIGDVSGAAYIQNLKDRWGGFYFRLPARLACATGKWSAETEAALVSYAEAMGVGARLAVEWSEALRLPESATLYAGGNHVAALLATVPLASQDRQRGQAQKLCRDMMGGACADIDAGQFSPRRVSLLQALGDELSQIA